MRQQPEDGENPVPHARYDEEVNRAGLPTTSAGSDRGHPSALSVAPASPIGRALSNAPETSVGARLDLRALDGVLVDGELVPESKNFDLHRETGPEEIPNGRG